MPEAPSAESAGIPGVTREIPKVGTASYAPRPIGTGVLATPEIRPRRADQQGPAGPAAAAASAAASGAAGAVLSTGVQHAGAELLASFDGLDHFDQRTANNGNQFSVEPADQGLCVGGGHVVEVVNDVFQVYHADGAGQTGVVDLNTFFGYPAAVDRATNVRGPLLIDPSCLYDPTTGTFFLVALTLQTTPAGLFTGVNNLDIAVAADPTGSWNVYRMDVTNDGSNGTPAHPNCPCIGDYPHVGVDANGFYITTNEYSFFESEFNGAQIYAFSKRALARGDDDVMVTQFETAGADRGFNGFTVWPAQSPTADHYSTSANGSQFFLSSNATSESNGTGEDSSSTSIVVWSLTNTASLDTALPDLRLHDARVPVRTYSPPPASNQKAGPAPLRECLNDDACAPNVLGEGMTNPFAPEPISTMDSSDTRMHQVTYANGTLYGALGTAVRVGGATKAGIAWYMVRPRSQASSLGARLTAEGRLGLAGNNLTYPALGVTAGGKGVIGFTLVGDDHFPSAAYARFHGRTGTGAISIAGAGAAPQDGFTGYRALGDPPRPRWGDYGAAAVDGDTIWTANQYIADTCTLAEYIDSAGTCNGTRTALANWATRISQVRP